MDKSKAKKLIITLISLFIILYVVYILVSSIFDLSSVDTEIAMEMTATDSIYKDGIIVRDETVVKNNNDGVLFYTASDGDQIAKGEVVAKLFNTENDALINQKIEDINDEITRLKKLNVSAQNGDLDIDTIDSQINSAITDFNTNIANRNFTKVSSSSDNITYLVTERLVVTDESVNIPVRINELKEEKKSLKSDTDNAIGSIKAKKAGCFVSSADGYESVYSYDNVKDVDIKQFNEMKKQKAKKVKDNVIGKLITNVNWYILCPVTESEALKITTSGVTSVTVNMPYAYTGSIPATIVSVNQSSEGGDSVMVIKCDYMDEKLAKIRSENVEICFSTYEGIRVSKEALHDSVVEKTVTDDNGKEVTKKKKVQGVYVLYGNELQFKEVAILYSGSDFVICDSSSDNEELFTGSTIKLYDKIVIKGSDLKDGKVIS
jgi:hypothetical protein